ncbi:hypothetical protein BELL_1530g00020 [Botrytis elliptica]|uniref:Uncharacterized protein n=1 Tax=Botrytis elliptica TaxID=278938 RepID=A0A4Z1IBT6_9HELO|nr:hypothetical protein BELL_1530g00020 [Botrytis elliptica]
MQSSSSSGSREPRIQVRELTGTKQCKRAHGNFIAGPIMSKMFNNLAFHKFGGGAQGPEGKQPLSSC